MESAELIEKLGTLTKRQRAILRLVCQGYGYRDITRELKIKVGTVKSTMANVYVKLDLDYLPTSERRKVLYQEVCQSLEGVSLPHPPPEPRREPRPERRVLGLVEDDERAIVVVEGELVDEDRPPLQLGSGQAGARPRRASRRRINPILVGLGRLLILALLIGLGVFVALGAYRIVFGGERLPIIPGRPTQIAQATATRRPVVNTPRPPTQRPAPTARPTSTVRPSSTPPRSTSTARPTNPPPPTNTPRPAATATPDGHYYIVEVSGEETDMVDPHTGPARPGSWTGTGVYVAAGDRLEMTFNGGEWWIGYLQNNQWWPQTPTDANGYTGREEERVVALLGADNPEYCYALRSAPIGSLIGRIGENGGPFYVGNGYHEVVNQTGVLYLRMNYNSPIGFAFWSAGQCPTTNGGSISVFIALTPGS